MNLRKDHYRVRALWVQPPIRVYYTLLLRRARRRSIPGIFSGDGARPPGGDPAPGPVPAGDTNTEHCLKVAV